MKAILFRSKDEGLKFQEIDPPQPKDNEVLIELHYASLNHLDLWIWKEKTLEKDVISGSDGSGLVIAVGPAADQLMIGKEVIINPSLYWGADDKRYSDDYQILGNPTNGTFAEYIVIPQEYVHLKPTHLNLQEAASLPLAALTAYRALFTKAAIEKNDKVLITGIGGGAAQYLLQMSVASEASVFVTSSSSEKIERAIEAGAKGGFNYKDAGWIEQVKSNPGGFDVIIDSAGGKGFKDLLEVANQAARIILFGRTAGDIDSINPGVIYNKQLQISGTVMGSPRDFEAMLRFYEEHQLKPVIDREFGLEEIDAAREYMESGKQLGKILLKIR